MTTWYHYTSPAGLQGIVTKKSLWASEYRFLNDASEFEYGLKVFDEVLQSERRRLVSVSLELPELISNLEREARNNHVFIVSFSEARDLLSQWRGYAAGAGFSLGFNADWIVQNGQKQGFADIPVIYDRAQQEGALRARLALLPTLVQEERGTDRYIHTALARWWPLVLTTLPAIKDSHFFEEHERRLVKVVNEWPADQIKTRYTDRGFTPYINFQLDCCVIDNPVFHPLENVGMTEVIVGPGLHHRQIIAVDALLATQRMRVPVTRSSIPFVTT